MKDYFSEIIKFNEHCASLTKSAISNMAALVQHLATANAENLGYGRQQLIEKCGGIWIVSKIRFKINKLPNPGSEIKAETWPLPPGKIKVCRQYRVLDGSEVLLAGASEWCIINAETRRPIRIEDRFLGKGYDYIIEESGAGEFSRMRYEITEEDFAYERLIEDSDIDINGHTNNTKYTDMVLGCFNDEFLAQNQLKTYELHFVKETLLSQRIRIYKTKIENGFFVTGKADNLTVFNALLEF